MKIVYWYNFSGRKLFTDLMDTIIHHGFFKAGIKSHAFINILMIQFFYEIIRICTHPSTLKSGLEVRDNAKY